MANHWPETTITSVDHLHSLLLARGADSTFIWRGQAEPWASLQPSLCRFLSHLPYPAKLERERQVAGAFSLGAACYLPARERNLLSQGLYIGDGYYSPGVERIAALTVLQHYGVPTRLLDWTRSPWVGAYFACMGGWDEPGVLWGFDCKALTDAADAKWESLGVAREAAGHVDLNAIAFQEQPLEWVVAMDVPVPFSRMEAQQGCFTVAGSLDRNHDELISGLIPSRSLQKHVIPAKLKGGVTRLLRRMNVHSMSLNYPGADLAAARLRDQLRDESLRQC